MNAKQFSWPRAALFAVGSTNITKVTFVVVLASAVVFSDELSADEPSAFDAFKTFCIETDIEKEAVTEKALSLGALPLKLPEDELGRAFASLTNAQVDKVAWLAKLGTRQFEVYFTSTDLPASPGQHAIHTDACNVIFRSDDARGMNDMEHWVDISDDEAIKLPAIGSKSYEFEIIDGKRVPLPKSWRVDPRFSRAVTWKAEVMQWRAISLSLERTKPL